MATDDSDAVFQLRPLNLADLFDVVIRLYRQNFGEIVRIAAVVYVPLGILQVASAAVVFEGFDVDSPVPQLPGISLIGFAGYIAFFVLFFFSIPLVQAAVAKAVAEIYLGGDISLGSVYRFALRRWASLIGVMILNGLIAVVTVIVGLIPAGLLMGGIFAFGPDGGAESSIGLIGAVAGLVGTLIALHVLIAVTVKLFFGPLVVVLEEAGPVQALRRSWALTGQHFWRILIAVSLLWLLVTVLTGIVVWPAQLASYFLQSISFGIAQAVLNGLSAFAQLFIQPIHIIGTVLLYYDLRMRKEGFDLVMMAEAVGEPQLAERAPSGEARPALYGPQTPQAPQNGDEHESPRTDHIS
jgi:hypothetical protein